jgi:hypothetical protein
MKPSEGLRLEVAAGDWTIIAEPARKVGNGPPEAEACGRGHLPAWEPAAAGARACGATTADEIDLVLRIARESWTRLQKHWTTEGDCPCEICGKSSALCTADLSARLLAARED